MNTEDAFCVGFQVWGQRLSRGNRQFEPLKARRTYRLLARAEVKDDEKASNSQPTGGQSFLLCLLRDLIVRVHFG